MVADLLQRKGTIRGCFKNTTAVVLQQCQNQVSFQRNGSGLILKFLLTILKGGQCFLFMREHFLSFKNVVKILIRYHSPSFENLLYFDIAGEQKVLHLEIHSIDKHTFSRNWFRIGSNFIKLYHNTRLNFLCNGF